MKGQQIAGEKNIFSVRHGPCARLFSHGENRISRLFAGILVCVLLLVLAAGSLLANPVTVHQAELAVRGWLKTDDTPLGAILGEPVREIVVCDDENGEPVYYIVYLEPSGFVIVPADDLVEPIVGFVEKGTYDPSPENPLGALADRDIRGRIAEVRNMQEPVPEAMRGRTIGNQSKWYELTGIALGFDDLGILPLMGLSSVDDPRVDPLVQSKWDQRICCSSPSLNCYNYYTPDNYHCGCVATAMAQVMRYYQYPTTGIGVHSFTIEVNGVSQSASTRGGDGSGGDYSWSDMVLEPNCSTTPTQRQAIGALCYDAGVTVGMNYTSSGSWANTLDAVDAFTGTFKYGNAIKGFNSESQIPMSNLYGMMNPNLDGKHPVLLAIKGGGEDAHAVVCDGYGYNTSTLYHHINFGWSGNYNAWYNLPDFSPRDYTTIYKCVYNIRKTLEGDGEMISGRVLDENGDPMSIAVVTADDPVGMISLFALTDDRGIYAFGNLDSAKEYTVLPRVNGYVFVEQAITTGTSTNLSSSSGNTWGVDFQGDVLEITSITPSSGPLGTYMTIEGQSFGSSEGEVIFPAGKRGQEVVWSDTVVYCRVPDNTVSGNVRIQTAELHLSLGVPFTVTDPDELTVDDDHTEHIENGTVQYPFSKIERGIHSATTGDTVTVNEGTYTENIDFNGKNITVTGADSDSAAVVALTVIDGGGSGPVVTFENGEDSSCLLSGFTITNGDAGLEFGGGIFCEGESSPSITGCVITGNSAGTGGGMFCGPSCQPDVTKCVFSDNSSDMQGGGVALDHSFFPAFDRCVFQDNSADMDGGGMHLAYQSYPDLMKCVFQGNTTLENGGGMSLDEECSPMLENCTFAGNKAEMHGGAIICHTDCHPSLSYCTFADNESEFEGGAMYIGPGCFITIFSSIFWDDSPDEIHDNSGNTDLYSCDIEGGWTGVCNGNIDGDPLFAKPGHWDGDNWIEGDYHLLGGSPCIDAGTVAGDDDIDGEARPQAGDYDMGSDELLDSDGDGLGDWSETNTFGTYPDDPDSDDDLMPDGWEVKNGFDPLDDSDAGEDADGDGCTNYEEYVASTDPRDPSSFFAVVDIERAADPLEVEITWKSVDGKYYAVYYSDDELGGAMSWTLGEDNVLASGTGTNTWTDDGSLTTPGPDEVSYRCYKVGVYED